MRILFCCTPLHRTLTATYSNHCTTGWMPSLFIHYAMLGAHEPCPMKFMTSPQEYNTTHHLPTYCTSRAFCSWPNTENRPPAKSFGPSTRESSGLGYLWLSSLDGTESLGTTARRRPSLTFRAWGH
jgi:hypothetical protein